MVAGDVAVFGRMEGRGGNVSQGRAEAEGQNFNIRDRACVAPRSAKIPPSGAERVRADFNLFQRPGRFAQGSGSPEARVGSDHHPQPQVDEAIVWVVADAERAARVVLTDAPRATPHHAVA